MIPLSRMHLAVLAALAFGVSGCAVGPTYQVPTSAESPVYKEAAGFVVAAPADTLEKGPWWQLFGDATLNSLAESVEVSNQNIAAAVANYAQARALVAQQRLMRPLKDRRRFKKVATTQIVAGSYTLDALVAGRPAGWHQGIYFRQ